MQLMPHTAHRWRGVNRRNWMGCAGWIGLLLFAAVSVSALEVRQVKWGFDGQVVPGRFNLLSVLVANPDAAPFDGTVNFYKSRGLAERVGAVYKTPCYLSPLMTRWLQFYVFIDNQYDQWRLEWGRGPDDHHDLDPPKWGPPAQVLLSGSDTPLNAVSAFKQFPEELFPPTVAATSGLDTVLLDHAPHWEPAKRQAVEPVLRLIGLGVSLVIAAATGAGMMAEWPTLALFWYAPRAAGGVVDPIFGKPLNFFLFTLPAWQLIAGWLLTLAVIACLLAVFFILITGGGRVLAGRLSRHVTLPWRGLSIAFAFLLLILAMRAYIGRFERLLEDHTIFGGVTYTDAHITLTGMLVVCAALVLGAVITIINAVRVPRGSWLVAAIIPAAVCYIAVQVVGWYVSSFIVKPNELVREKPYIVFNTELTRQAYGLNRVSQREFPAETTVESADSANNQPTLQNIRLWDWRALQDTLRQIQEIRTYYAIPRTSILIDITLMARLAR